MSAADDVAALWAEYLATLPPDKRPAGYMAWGFGDSPAMADELGELVLAGHKTATSSLLWEYDHDGEPVPEVGEHSVILDGQGRPLGIIETVEVVICPYREVDEAMAAAEGEGDRSLRHWRAAHWRYFGRRCAELGVTPADTMPVVWERFVLRYP